VDNGGFLTGKVCIWCIHDFDLHPVDANASSIMHDSVKALDSPRRHVQHDATRVERRGGKREAVEHQMGCVCQEELIFAAGWFSFGPVGHHHCSATSALEGPPLGANGKPGSSVASKAAGIKLVQKRGSCAMEW
jgi:hypothetical protein